MVVAMRARVSIASCLPALLGLSGACTSGTETGNPSLTSEGLLSYTGYSSKPDEFGVLEGGSIATVTRAWLDLDTVTISPEGNCGIERGGAFTTPGLGIGDHAAGKHNSTAYEAPQGLFCTVALPFLKVPASASGVPDELQGQSLLIEGNLADGTPFSIASRSAQVIELEAVGTGFELVKLPDVLMAFDFAAWLGAIDFADAALSDGRIIISDSSNVALLGQLEANLAAGVALYQDHNADGVVDSDAQLLAGSE